MGLPWRATDSEMRRHFEEYGPLVLCSVKRDPKSGDSRGFGFIRFQDYDAQVMCLANRHFIEGRWCDVKIPNSRVSENTIEYHIRYYYLKANQSSEQAVAFAIFLRDFISPIYIYIYIYIRSSTRECSLTETTKD